MHSDLTNVVLLSPNCSTRKHATYNPEGVVDTITIHHVAGDASVEALGALFGRASRQASSNYGIGSAASPALWRRNTAAGAAAAGRTITAPSPSRWQTAAALPIGPSAMRPMPPCWICVRISAAGTAFG